MYATLDWILGYVGGEQLEVCRQIQRDNRTLFERTPGSTHNHQAWKGGYLDHVIEVLNIAATIYSPLQHTRRSHPFSLADAFLVLFLHDIEKPWKYQVGPDGELEHIPEMRNKAAQHAFRESKLAEYGIILTDEQANALRYVEGELNDYSSRRRVMGPLAAFCHCCDVLSARMYFDYPLAEGDPWFGAKRERLT